MNREQWFDVMCRQVGFRPDRAAIREELKAHMDDRRDALVASGLAVPEAERAAVAAMGDPEEVGRQLNAIHQPLLGWAWKVSGWLLFLVLIAAGLCVYRVSLPSVPVVEELNSSPYRIYLDKTNESWQFAYGEPVNDRLRYAERPGTEDSWERYTFRISRAAVWDVGDINVFYGHLSVSGIWPWEDAPYLDKMYEVDDRGNVYVSMWEKLQMRVMDGEGPPAVRIEESHRENLSWEYAVEIPRFDPEAKWVELRLDWAGQNLAVRISLTGGAQP